MDESASSNPEMGHSLSSIEGRRRNFLTESESFNNPYDSTWEDDDGPEIPSSEFNIEWSRNAQRNTHAAKDMQNFRKMFQSVNCDDAADDEELGDVYSEREYCIPNLLFYQNKIASLPDGVYIKEFHEKWYGDYSRLEWVPSYIQWLFPIQEQGMNYDSQPLTPEEIKLFRKDDAAKKRLLKSYKLMLDFYGIKLLDEETGKVCRAEHWEERFKNLDRNTHNNLRITRILKCLGILGFEHYQAPLVRFFLTETLVEGRLPRVKRSVLDYFMFSVLNTSERKELIRFAFEQFEPKREFVWCPKRIQRRFLKEIKARKAETPEKSRDPSGSKPCESEEIQKQNEEASNALSAQNAQNDQSSDAGKADTNPNLKMHNNQEGPQKNLNLNPDHTDTATENQNTSDTDNGNEASEAQLQGSNKPPTTASREDVEMDTDPPNQEEVSGPAATEEFIHHNSDEHSKYSEHEDPSESGPSEGKESQPENGETPNAPTVQNVKNAESSGVEKETHTNQNLMTLNKKQSLKPDHCDTATENQNTSDTNKGNEELEAPLPCNNNTPSTTGSGDNAEKMYVNEGSGSIGTDNKMDIDCSSETSAQQSDEDKKKLLASHISDDESKDEHMDLGHMDRSETEL
uniref:Opioid growth factor receptor (OGFr) conserved domain-containing protein n=1 Tax=Pygocentrus nattereri TaxID=42514 RepID=A0A3B4C4G6_PYGNA